MPNFKYSNWSTQSKTINMQSAKVVLFISRNKDNKDLKGFKERKISFLTCKEVYELIPQFDEFVNKGLTTEHSRFYMSVNARDLNKVKKALIHRLLDSETFSELVYPEAYIAGIAAKHENALTKKWLLDVDTKDQRVLDDVISYIISKNVKIELIQPTIYGYHIITSEGFDPRELITKYSYVTIKRDDLYLVTWSNKL